MMSRSRSPSPQDPLSDDDSSDDAELASLASSLARGGGWRSSLLWRVACRVASFVFRPVRELFFLLSWVVWLFSSITIGGGQHTRGQTERRGETGATQHSADIEEAKQLQSVRSAALRCLPLIRMRVCVCVFAVPCD